jgi:hypothetical protein
MRRLTNLLCLFSVLLLLQVGASITSYAQSPSTEAVVPEFVVYEFYFHRIVYFDDFANKKEQEGKDGNSARAVVKNELGISDAQRAVFTRICKQSLQDVASLDAKAAAIIQAAHARYPNGKLLSKEQVPQVPAELAQLQETRELVFKNAKAQLMNYFGTASFPNIDSRVKAVIKVHVSMQPNNKSRVIGSHN